jgi:hypothetical protein
MKKKRGVGANWAEGGCCSRQSKTTESEFQDHTISGVRNVFNTLVLVFLLEFIELGAKGSSLQNLAVTPVTVKLAWLRLWRFASKKRQGV